MKNILLIVLLSLLSVQSKAQNLSIPENPKLEVAEDYRKYEDLVLRCISYLYDNPANVNGEKRLECMSFLVKWMDGAPNVTVFIHAELVDMKEFEVMFAYMGAFVEYALGHEGADELEIISYAVKKSVSMYEKNEDHLKKGKVMRKLLRAKRKGELDSYIKDVYR